MNLRALCAVLLVTGPAAGCSAIDRQQMSGFTRIGDGEYLFTARAGSRGYPVDSAAAEAVRIGWLEEYLAANRACPNGYDVVSRDATSRGGDPGRRKPRHRVPSPLPIGAAGLARLERAGLARNERSELPADLVSFTPSSSPTDRPRRRLLPDGRASRPGRLAGRGVAAGSPRRTGRLGLRPERNERAPARGQGATGALPTASREPAHG